ncbi:MAG: sialate O-acetylesterase [Bacteroidota bacterium]
MKMIPYKYLISTLLSCLLLSCFTFSHAAITLPSIFADNMVLQQNAEVTIWGWGKPVENVTVNCSWAKGTKETVVDSQGNWRVTVATPKAGGPFVIRIKGKNEIILNNVMCGEVWLCSGQSNMEWTAVLGINDAKAEIENANYSDIRLFTVNHRSATSPQLNANGYWETCTSESMKNFSAVAYFFARKLHKEMDIPIGVINASWGGTPVEIWMSANRIEADEKLLSASKTFTGIKWGPHKPGRAYNTMIAPLSNFKIAGALWYQGETNTANAHAYTNLLTT